MNTNVRTIGPDQPADAAWELMRQHSIHHLVVVEKGEPLGVVSARDLGGRSGPSVRKGRSVLDLMSPQLVSAKPDTSVKQAANLLRGHGIGCIPVMDGGKLKGIVTVSDLLELLGRGTDKPTARTERAILSRRQGVSPKRRR